MTAEIVVPKIGLTVESVEVIAWLKEVGDEVAEGDTVVEVAADKADVEVKAPESGTLTEILVDAGETAVLGEVLGRLNAFGQTAAPSPEVSATPVAEAQGKGAARSGLQQEVIGAEQPSASTTNGHRIRVSPLARRAAETSGVELSALLGTGPRRRIVLRDVRAAVAQMTAPPVRRTPVPDSEEISRGMMQPPQPPDVARAAGDMNGAALAEVRFTAARRATARLMAVSRDTVAPVTLHARAPADQALKAVRKLKADGLPATFSHAVIVASARALARHPPMNAIWDGERLLQSKPVHVGIAVDDDGDLLSAVLPHASELDVIATILGAVNAVARARAREAAKVQATFTISNLGMFGVEQFTPIIAPPQIAVLGVGAIVDGRCHLSLTFDHRAIDGAPAARFLSDVRDHLSAFDGH
jgi:pyruvate dehydrogenase E2 component (dihydrolipoamide acetyltransferase)